MNPENNNSTATSHKHRLVVFNAKKYDVDSFRALEKEYSAIGVTLEFLDSKLNLDSMHHAKGAMIVCVFVNDLLEGPVVEYLKQHGTQLVTLRCAGFDRVNLEACRSMEMSVTRVPVYSPFAVAEHAVALTMFLNRRFGSVSKRMVKGNFSLSNDILGFDMRGKTVGILGTGNVGQVTGKIFLGFGCKLLCYDLIQNKELASLPNTEYRPLDEVLANSDVISLHLPLFPSTRHIINEEALRKMKRDVLIINTSRGALIDTTALLEAVNSGHIRGAGLDVYENEGNYFFEDYSEKKIDDQVLKELMVHPNIILTPHQAFFTVEALSEIAKTTFNNVKEFVVDGKRLLEMTNTCLK